MAYRKLIKKSAPTQSASLLGGVYMITCSATGRSYCGSSENLNNRYKAHCSALKRGVHCNKKLQCDYNDHGENSFIFVVWEKIATKTAREDLEYAIIKELIRNGIAYNRIGRRSREERRLLKLKYGADFEDLG